MSESQAEAAGPRKPRCDHVCLLDDGHVERGELHQYGYELPSPRRDAEVPGTGAEPPVARPVRPEDPHEWEPPDDRRCAICGIDYDEHPTPDYDIVLPRQQGKVIGHLRFEPVPDTGAEP